MIVKNCGSEINAGLVNNLIYLNYAFNRDKNMSHEDLVSILNLDNNSAKRFGNEYDSELLKDKNNVR